MPNRTSRSNGASHKNGARSARERAARQQQQPAQQPRGGRRSSHRAGSGISKAPARVVSTIQANPIPAIMIGAGLTWLLLGQRVSSMGESKLVQRGRRRLSELGETFGESFTEAAEGASDTMRRAASSVREGLSSIGEYAHEGVDAVRRSTRRGVESVSEAASSAWERHPLAVCAAILAAGVTAGMILPATQRENRTMGRASEAVVRRARKRGTKLIKQSQRLASEALDVAGREARRQGLTPRDLGQKVKRVARRAKSSIAGD